MRAGFLAATKDAVRLVVLAWPIIAFMDERLLSAGDLRRWYYFAALADEMSFTRASRRLYTSQPSLSQQIRAFEDGMGVALLERHGPRFELTQAGRAAAVEASLVLEQVQRSTERIRAAAREDTGRLRIAYTRSAPTPHASEIVRSYRRRYSGVRVELETGWTARNIQLLEEGALDAAFVRPPIESPLVDVKLVAHEEILIALPHAHPLAAHERLTRDQIADEPVVFWSRANAPGQYDAITTQVWPDHPPNVVQDEPDDEQLMQAVAEGAGIAAMPEHRARTLQARDVAFRRLTDPVPRVELGLAYRTDGANPLVSKLLELIDER